MSNVTLRVKRALEDLKKATLSGGTLYTNIPTENELPEPGWQNFPAVTYNNTGNGSRKLQVGGVPITPAYNSDTYRRELEIPNRKRNAELADLNANTLARNRANALLINQLAGIRRRPAPAPVPVGGPGGAPPPPVGVVGPVIPPIPPALGGPVIVPAVPPGLAGPPAFAGPPAPFMPGPPGFRIPPVPPGVRTPALPRRPPPPTGRRPRAAARPVRSNRRYIEGTLDPDAKRRRYESYNSDEEIFDTDEWLVRAAADTANRSGNLNPVPIVGGPASTPLSAPPASSAPPPRFLNPLPEVQVAEGARPQTFTNFGSSTPSSTIPLVFTSTNPRIRFNSNERKPHMHEKLSGNWRPLPFNANDPEWMQIDEDLRQFYQEAWENFVQRRDRAKSGQDHADALNFIENAEGLVKTRFNNRKGLPKGLPQSPTRQPPITPMSTPQSTSGSIVPIIGASPQPSDMSGTVKVIEKETVSPPSIVASSPQLPPQPIPIVPIIGAVPEAPSPVRASAPSAPSAPPRSLVAPPPPNDIPQLADQLLRNIEDEDDVWLQIPSNLNAVESIRALKSKIELGSEVEKQLSKESDNHSQWRIRKLRKRITDKISEMNDQLVRLKKRVQPNTPEDYELMKDELNELILLEDKEQQILQQFQNEGNAKSAKTSQNFLNMNRKKINQLRGDIERYERSYNIAPPQPDVPFAAIRPQSPVSSLDPLDIPLAPIEPQPIRPGTPFTKQTINPLTPITTEAKRTIQFMDSQRKRRLSPQINLPELRREIDETQREADELERRLSAAINDFELEDVRADLEDLKEKNDELIERFKITPVRASDPANAAIVEGINSDLKRLNRKYREIEGELEMSDIIDEGEEMKFKTPAKDDFLPDVDLDELIDFDSEGMEDEEMLPYADPDELESIGSGEEYEDYEEEKGAFPDENPNFFEAPITSTKKTPFSTRSLRTKSPEFTPLSRNRQSPWSRMPVVSSSLLTPGVQPESQLVHDRNRQAMASRILDFSQVEEMRPFNNNFGVPSANPEDSVDGPGVITGFSPPPIVPALVMDIVTTQEAQNPQNVSSLTQWLEHNNTSALALAFAMEQDVTNRSRLNTTMSTKDRKRINDVLNRTAAKIDSRQTSVQADKLWDSFVKKYVNVVFTTKKNSDNYSSAFISDLLTDARQLYLQLISPNNKESAEMMDFVDASLKMINYLQRNHPISVVRYELRNEIMNILQDRKSTYGKRLIQLAKRALDIEKDVTSEVSRAKNYSLDDKYSRTSHAVSTPFKGKTTLAFSEKLYAPGGRLEGVISSNQKKADNIEQQVIDMRDYLTNKMFISTTGFRNPQSAAQAGSIFKEMKKTKEEVERFKQSLSDLIGVLTKHATFAQKESVKNRQKAKELVNRIDDMIRDTGIQFTRMDQLQKTLARSMKELDTMYKSKQSVEPGTFDTPSRRPLIPPPTRNPPQKRTKK